MRVSGTLAIVLVAVATSTFPANARVSGCDASEARWKKPNECTQQDEHCWEDLWHNCERVWNYAAGPDCFYACDGVPLAVAKYIDGGGEY
jgi:hypothetical protein